MQINWTKPRQTLYELQQTPRYKRSLMTTQNFDNNTLGEYLYSCSIQSGLLAKTMIITNIMYYRGECVVLW